MAEMSQKGLVWTRFAESWKRRTIAVRESNSIRSAARDRWFTITFPMALDAAPPGSIRRPCAPICQTCPVSVKCMTFTFGP
jgi:hypothetical protein